MERIFLTKSESEMPSLNWNSKINGETEPLYKNNSTIKCDYLKRVFEDIHLEMFSSDVNIVPHTYDTWKLFWETFKNNEYVKEYQSSQYILSILKV